MKKYLYNFVIATLILMSTTVVKASNEVYYTNINNIDMTEKEYNNLLGLGFTERQIQNMDQDLFLENKNIEGTVLAETVKYYRNTTVMRNGIKYITTKEITKEEAMQDKQSQTPPTRDPSGNYYDGVSANSSLEIRTKIIGVDNYSMRYKIDAEWLTIPSDRYYDIMGIGFDSTNLQITTTIVFREDWMKTDGTHGYTTVCYPKTESTGGSVQMKLPTGSLYYIDSFMYFEVSKKQGVGTLTSLLMGGDYAHATSNLNPSTMINKYSVYLPAGISINSSYSSYYTSLQVAYAGFSGTW